MKRVKSILLKLLRPGAIWTVCITLLAVMLLIYIFASGNQDSMAANISYGFCAYAMVVLIFGFPNIIQQVRALISKNKYGKIYLNDIELRARISLYSGLFINLIFAAFYFVTSLLYSSPWFWAVAVYYVVLGVMRFILLFNVRKASAKDNVQERMMHELRSYRLCGYLMFALIIGMAGMIFQMIWQNKGYYYSGSIIYISALYAFYCMIVAIYNVIKFRGMSSPLLSAAKMLGFAGALMSMLALQTAMISQFGAGDESFRQIMNSASGVVVCVIVFCMAVFMIIRANHELKKQQ